MICPYCSAFCDDDLRYCDLCGADLTDPVQAECDTIPVIQVTETQIPPKTVTCTAPVAAPAVRPAVKKGRLWPPLVILIAMVSLGTLLFFLLPGTTAGPVAQNCFTVDKGVLTFHPEFYNGPSELIIPDTVNGQTVIAIADYAFSGVDSISSVVMPATVQHIGDYAFSSCHNLRGIYVPVSVTTIGVYAFADCDALEAIYLPGDLEQLGHGALDSCSSLRYILFNGTYAQWTSLYNGYFVSTVELHTVDGVYYTRP